MGVKIIPKFTETDIEKRVKAHRDNAHRQIVDRLSNVTMRFLKDARRNADFTDHTGNLRSSIAGGVYYNGQVIFSNFEKSSIGTDKEKGILDAKDHLSSLIPEFSKGYAIIVVAAEFYAGYVESKGKDVIYGSSLTAKNLLRASFKKEK